MSDIRDKDPLLDAFANLDEEKVLTLVCQRLEQGYDPFRLLKSCQAGLYEVGRLYEQGIYFLSGLIMGGVILERTLEIIKPLIEVPQPEFYIGNIVIGTVEGDIHDIGTSIVNSLLWCQGFNVINLGVNVSPEKFLDAVIEHQPKVLGLSCLITTAFKSLEKTILTMDEAGLRPGLPIIIGGGQLDSTVCDYVKADYWTKEASDGVAWIIRAARSRK